MEKIVSRTSTRKWDKNYPNIFILDRLREKDYIIGNADKFVGIIDNNKQERLDRLNQSMDIIKHIKSRNNRRFNEEG